jgi:hypothetical protein
VIIAIYVDDLLIIAVGQQAVINTARKLASKFELQDLGDVSFYLGCRIVRDRDQRKLWMVQDSYIDQLLEGLHLDSADDADTPFNPYERMEAATDDYIPSKNMLQRYQHIVGKIMWPSTQTRPDIAYATGVLSKYLVKPAEAHLLQAKRVVRYLKKTRKYGICFTGSNGVDANLEMFVDSSYADDLDSRRSTGGYVVKMAGAPTTWKSGRLPLVTLSSTESEYVALTLAAKEAVSVARLLQEVKYQGPITPVHIFEDSQPAIDLTKRSVSDGRTKHIDVRWHFIRQQIDNGTVKVSWIPTDQQVADGLTKPLDRTKFERYVTQLGVVDCTAAIQASQKDAGPLV